jgi:electron transfer flavoprotein beta subunit
VLTIQLGINKPRYASLRGIKQAAAKPIEEISLDGLGLSANAVGAGNSMSRVRRMYVPEKGRATMIEGTLAERAAKIIQIINEFKGA